jgi:hypothetical protein
MPFYGGPEFVECAVRSVLAQTQRDLRLVVIGDGQEPPLGKVRDSRLVVYTLPENWGTYFGFQLILQASPDAWHAPHGADDWTDPEHLESLLALNLTAVALRTTWVHDGDKATLTSIGSEGWHVGVFSSERLKAIGGYDPSARLSQDSNVLKLLDMTGGYHRHGASNPTYHIRKRLDSLTMAYTTGMTSQARRRQRAHDAQIRSKVRVMCRAGNVAGVRAYRESMIPLPIQAELGEHVERLREML